MLDEPYGNVSGRRKSAELLKRMRQLDISPWHPDPMAAIAGAEKRGTAI
ncbi:hypothetical protein [Bradyrhizobium sp. AUGA SZCCT0283]|nr:hypothetical protein [Bradyrhizobium sp. AUGA SZCCT0283]MBR1274516.1 hypothetical protein [Bradyrhizobium sp. AUGA SZCCT0283]